MSKCFFPGCNRTAIKVACPLHKTIRARWTTHNSMLRYRNKPPISLQEYTETSAKYWKRRIAKPIDHNSLMSDTAGPTVLYDGDGRPPCLKCDHGLKDHNRRGCVECAERVLFAHAGGVLPVSSTYSHFDLSLDAGHTQQNFV